LHCRVDRCHLLQKVFGENFGMSQFWCVPPFGLGQQRDCCD
jgi:hypothetical protein